MALQMCLDSFFFSKHTSKISLTPCAHPGTPILSQVFTEFWNRIYEKTVEMDSLPKQSKMWNILYLFQYMNITKS